MNTTAPSVEGTRELAAPAAGVASGDWFGVWETARAGEWQRTGRRGTLAIKLRVILGGNNLYTPLAEIHNDTPIVKIGPRGGKSLPTRLVLAELLRQELTPRDACASIDRWFEHWHSNYRIAPPNKKDEPTTGSSL